MKLLSLSIGLLSLLLSSGVVEAKQVVLEYDDFLQIIAIKEHSEKLKNKAMAENGVLVKLNDEKDVTITLQAKQIEACETIVRDHEKLGETQDQINQAVEAELVMAKQELEGEKSKHKWYAIGGAGVGVMIGMVIMVVVN